MRHCRGCQIDHHHVLIGLIDHVQGRTIGREREVNGPIAHQNGIHGDAIDHIHHAHHVAHLIRDISPRLIQTQHGFASGFNRHAKLHLMPRVHLEKPEHLGHVNRLLIRRHHHPTRPAIGQVIEQEMRVKIQCHNRTVIRIRHVNNVSISTRLNLGLRLTIRGTQRQKVAEIRDSVLVQIRVWIIARAFGIAIKMVDKVQKIGKRHRAIAIKIGGHRAVCHKEHLRFGPQPPARDHQHTQHSAKA